jgi:tight adherence protein C
MSGPGAIGALLGAAVGIGLLLTMVRLPVMRRPSLADRVAPFVAPRPGPPTHAAATPLPLLGSLLSPTVQTAARWLERHLGGGDVVARRLRAAGSTTSVDQYRAEQVLLATVGVLAGVALGVILLFNGSLSSPIPLVGLVLALGVGGILLRDAVLSAAIRRREELMLAELPTVADLLALSVAAGEGPVASLRRVCEVGQGELTAELRYSLADTQSGASLVDALDATAARSTLPALQRFVDGIAVALERGTPLADVLRAQAADVRDARKRALMETGGRKEVLMLVPVVFLVLPVTVLFALFPGIAQFSAIVG